MSDKISSLMAQFNAGARAQAVTIPEEVIETTVSAVLQLNEKGGKAEVFRVLHIIFGYNKPSIVKAVSHQRPQMVYNNLEDIKVEKHRERVLNMYGSLKGTPKGKARKS